MQTAFGVIFDWDGVIIDSSRTHELSWEQLARETGRSLPEGHFKKGFGMKNERIIPELLGWTTDEQEIHRLSLRKEELYRAIVRQSGLDALPGVRSWLKTLHENKIPCVVGSSTHRENISLALELIGIGQYFSSVVTGDDVTRGKPDPEIFLKAAMRIPMDPTSCVVFEDTPVGIEAAHAGGMKAVAVLGTHPRDRFPDVELIVTRMDELTIESLRALFR